jgi:ARG/rhodanese/phosphatase superfamily protein
MVTPKFSPVLGFLRDLEILPPVSVGGSEVFGLKFDPWHKRISHLHLLKESLGGGAITIREIDLHHGAPSIWLVNDSNRRIFLPAGEGLPVRGGERTLRVSLVLGAQQTLKIQPDLLEAGPPPAADAGGPLAHLHREATGAAFARGSQVLGMQLFERREVFRRLFPSILARRDARDVGATSDAGSPPASEALVKEWLGRASLARVEVHPSFGVGREVLIEDRDFHGRCLFIDDLPAHVEIDRATGPSRKPEAHRQAGELEVLPRGGGESGPP